MVVFSILLLCALPLLIVLNAVVLPRVLTALAERIWPERSGEFSSVLSIALAFDSDQALVWNTQVPLLQLILQSGSQGISVPRLRNTYGESVRRYPEIYEGFTFQQWLWFLDEAQLVICGGKRVFLTRKGIDFLRYGLTTRTSSASSSPPCCDDLLRHGG